MRHCHFHHRPRRLDHWIVCQHQIEVELWPASVEVYFRDERFTDPVNTQARFDAAVYNAPDSRVKWEVRALDGSPGRGQIDATGLYRAPDKDGLDSGLTEVIVVTSLADPMRQAFGYVTVVGRGPKPLPKPCILVLPQRVVLYHRNGHNGYIDESNSKQVFRAIVRHSEAPLQWLIGSTVKIANDTSRLFGYDPATMPTPVGPDGTVTVTARLTTDSSVVGSAKVVLADYDWPAILI